MIEVNTPLDCDPVPTVSLLVAWKAGNASRLVRELVDLAIRCGSVPKDAPRLTRKATKS